MPVRRQSGWGTLPPGALQRQAQLDLALRSGRAEDAGPACAPLAAGDKDGAVAREVAGILAKKNCAAAADWVSRLGNPPAQEKACTALVETWSVRDPAAAAAWLETLPAGKMRDAGLETYAGRVAKVDPAAAAEWAGHITDRTERGNAAGSIFPSFPNSIWERHCGRNSISRGGGVCGRERLACPQTPPPGK